ncbi:predicted protein [Naegleria gruberi]|uniref:Predicted protein n=1 Tax=Naegleria gruberi TaxID=5762 RepID=D2VWQ1_NAEGR|nr:uncharacterized protein NAEGRDRAFT_81500 [Naegleria gruberi]EFC38660.1 predicted protein [Naegleria gruberi]|eukprot:XP_002671404.1 predicted protein [Naegleria gruberi strain NEG-M]
MSQVSTIDNGATSSSSSAGGNYDAILDAGIDSIDLSNHVHLNRELEKASDDQKEIVYPTLNSEIATIDSSNKVAEKKEFVSKALLVSIGVGGMGGYMSGNVIRIGSRVVFGAIAAVLLLGTTFTSVSRTSLRKKTSTNKMVNDLEQYEMLAKIGIDAANKQLQNINFREIIVHKWDQLKEYTKDNYALTSSFLLGFIISMF